MYIYIPELVLALGASMTLGLVLFVIWYPIAMCYHRLKTGKWHWFIS